MDGIIWRTILVFLLSTKCNCWTFFGSFKWSTREKLRFRNNRTFRFEIPFSLSLIRFWPMSDFNSFLFSRFNVRIPYVSATDWWNINYLNPKKKHTRNKKKVGLCILRTNKTIVTAICSCFFVCAFIYECNSWM